VFKTTVGQRDEKTHDTTQTNENVQIEKLNKAIKDDQSTQQPRQRVTKKTQQAGKARKTISCDDKLGDKRYSGTERGGALRMRRCHSSYWMRRFRWDSCNTFQSSESGKMDKRLLRTVFFAIGKVFKARSKKIWTFLYKIQRKNRYFSCIFFSRRFASQLFIYVLSQFIVANVKNRKNFQLMHKIEIFLRFSGKNAYF